MSEMRGVTEVNGTTQEFRYFVDGEWRTAENKKLFDVYRPYDRSVHARVASCGRPEATLAVDAAAERRQRPVLARGHFSRGRGQHRDREAV